MGMGRDIATLAAKLDPRGVIVGTRQANAALDKMAMRCRRAATGLTRGFGGLRSQLLGLKGLIGTLGFGLLAKSLMGTGVAFEHSMAKVGGIMEATGKEMKDLTALAREMGETTEFKATQAASGLEFLGMAGFSAEKAMAALPGVLDLATAGQVDLGRAADITSNVLTAMRLPVEELGRVNDVLVKTITSSNTNMEMLAESLKYSAPLAAGLGIEVEELSAMIGMLGSAGIQGSMAGTQLAFAMQRLGKGFDALGVSATDTMGEMRSIPDFLEELEKSELGAKEKTDLLMKAFKQRGGKAMLALFGQGSEAVREYTATIHEADGASTKLATTMRATTRGAIDELKSVIESLKIDAFESEASMLNDTIRDLTETIRDNKDALIEFLNMIVKGVGHIVELTAYIVEMVNRTKGWFDLMKTDQISFWEWAMGGKEEAQTKLKEIDDLNAKAKEFREGWITGGQAPRDMQQEMLDEIKRQSDSLPPEAKKLGPVEELGIEKLTGSDKEQLQDKLAQLQEHLMTEQEAIRYAYDARLAIVQTSLDQEMISQMKAAELIAGLRAKMTGELVAKEVEAAEAKKASSVADIESMRASLMTEQEAIQASFTAKQAIIDEALALRTITQLDHMDLIAAAIAARDTAELARLKGVEDAKQKIVEDANAAKAKSDASYAKVKSDVTDSLVGLLQQYAGKSKAAALVLIAIDKARAMAQIAISTQVAAMGALASVPWPYGLAAYAKVQAMGKLAQGLVLATGFAEAGAVISGSSGAGGGAGTYDSPVVTTPAGVGSGEQLETDITIEIDSDRLDPMINRSAFGEVIGDTMAELIEATGGKISRRSNVRVVFS